jgi:hypothetical protein
LIPRTVSDAFEMPSFTASAKLVGDDEVISITLTTLMRFLLVGW